VSWNPQASSLTVLQWQETGAEILWTNQSSALITGKNQFLVADLDGDGSDEIVTWNPILLTLSSSKWQASSLQQFGQDTVGELKTPDGTMITLNDNNQWYAADIDGDGCDEIVTLNTATGNVCVLKWQESMLVCVWTNGETSTNPLAAQTSLCFADLDGDGKTEILTWNPSFLTLLISKWQNSTIAQVGFAMATIPGWGLELIVAGPKTTFADHPFVGAQLDVYHYISRKLSADLLGTPDPSDIRSAYTNMNITVWGDLADKLGNLQNPGYQEADWDAVKQILTKELKAVDPVNAMIGNMDGLLETINNQQTADMATDVTNFTISPESQVGYWLGQIMQAALWAAAAFPEAKLAQAGLAAVTSLLGSALSAMGGDSEQTVTYATLQATIDNAYVVAKRTNDGYQQTVLTDAVMLPVVGALAEDAWGWDSQIMDDAVTSPTASNANRIVFYQTLIPSVFKIWYLENVDSDDPGDFGIFLSWNEPPPHAYFVEQLSNSNFNIYILLTISGGEHGYPSKELSYDLFTTLAISRDEFFKGANGWQSITRVKQTPQRN
jgi:hypothetical protein